MVEDIIAKATFKEFNYIFATKSPILVNNVIGVSRWIQFFIMKLVIN